MPPDTQFVVDAQLPPLLAKRMTRAGYPAIHVIERLDMTATDRAVALLANELGAAVMSKDSDFVDLLRREILQTALVWVRCGNVSPATLWSIVEPRLADIASDVAAGRQYIEIL